MPEGATKAMVRRARAEDAPALARLAARTFEETFADANNPGDLSLYIQTTYGADLQLAEINSPAIVTWLAEDGETLAGFAQLRAGPPPECVRDRSAIELWRLYVDAPWHGKGVAAALMDAVIAEAARRRIATVWLGVWEHNPRAQRFYRKQGFEMVGTHRFLMGTDDQTDQVMIRQI